MRRLASEEQGQSLVQFAFVIVILLVFVALAIDVGSAYSERRRMQNAADAAALAGARELCMGHSATAAEASARDYLLRNGVPDAEASAHPPVVSGNKVKTTAVEKVKTSMAGVMGWKEIQVSATSAAACGAAASACGLWPIAFDYAIWEGVKCGESLVVWDADKDNNDISCAIGGVTRDICDCYDCDLDDNGTDDFVVMTKLARGWMDFPSSTDPVYTDSCKANGCGASELACRIQSGSGGKTTLPACIPGLRGVKAGVKDEVDDRAGELVQIPLYTSINCASGSNCSGTEAQSYYVTKFGCVTVGGWNQSFTLNPKPGMPKSYQKIKTKTITVSKSCGGSCMTFCGSGSDRPPEAGEVKAAFLSQ